MKMWINFRNKMKEDDGQAIFEFVVFIPFFLVLFVVFFAISGSINGSINQNKATRGYFYYTIRNNSMIPSADDLALLQGNGITATGAYAFGWRESARGNTPFATCYKLRTFIKTGKFENERCESNIDPGETKSAFVKVFTAYGVCTGQYVTADKDRIFYNPLSWSSSTCTITR